MFFRFRPASVYFFFSSFTSLFLFRFFDIFFIRMNVFFFFPFLFLFIVYFVCWILDKLLFATHNKTSSLANWLVEHSKISWTVMLMHSPCSFRGNYSQSLRWRWHSYCVILLPLIPTLVSLCMVACGIYCVPIHRFSLFSTRNRSNETKDNKHIFFTIYFDWLAFTAYRFGLVYEAKEGERGGERAERAEKNNFSKPKQIEKDNKSVFAIWWLATWNFMCVFFLRIRIFSILRFGQSSIRILFLFIDFIVILIWSFV